MRVPLRSPFASCLLLVCFLVANRSLASDPAEIARLVDSHLARSHQLHHVEPAAICDDSTFFRRLCLDLIGRIPTAEEALAFLHNSASDKRERAIDHLLNSPEHSLHFAQTWRRLLLPESDTDQQLRYFVPGFEAWLSEKRGEKAGFDRMVHELIAVPITGTSDRPQIVLRDLKAANAVAFIAGKDASPAELAAATTRMFLGIRLECAQCHDHPFDHWTQQQFWNQAAFFTGIQRNGRGAFAPIFESFDRREIQVHDSELTVRALFLDKSQPTTIDGVSPRTALADWITDPKNTLFSRAIVNRFWADLMGRGIVDPVDDMHAQNPPSHPELLQLLATHFSQSGFDIDLIYRGLCRSELYQRSSQLENESQRDESQFARKFVKPMTGEQFFDSFAVATEFDQHRNRTGGKDHATRRRVIEIFSNHGSQREPDTSVLQALTLMNGQLVHQATSPASSQVLGPLLEDSALSDTDRIDHLYLRVLSRLPTDRERDDLITFIQSGEPTDRPSRWSDIFWMLLNSAEFRWNH